MVSNNEKREIEMDKYIWSPYGMYKENLNELARKFKCVITPQTPRWVHAEDYDQLKVENERLKREIKNMYNKKYE